MTFREFKPEELLGRLNETEQRNAPKALFAAGDTSILERGGRVAIVGSRKASSEALSRARKLAGLVVKNGGVVVSGLAAGIDTAAHTAAIQHGGKTIAVIGTPLDRCYPKENREFQDEIARNHLLVSQFPVGYPMGKRNFIMRNRTMALICDVSVIVEAGETSGSISQGWETLRLGRPLFIMKAVAENPALAWPRELLEYGAQILSDDCLPEFQEQIPTREPFQEASIAF